MGQVSFSHQEVGDLVVANGLDNAQWGYNLNTANFPTYGGEVVQILSVYIDDLTIQGTLSTYAQAEAIYSYFASYLQVASQGTTGKPQSHGASGSAYNLYPVYFSYPERDWFFKLYPKTVPGFHYGRDVVTPTWQISAHVVDDSPDLDLIKHGIKALAASNKLPDGQSLKLTGEISPNSGNPDTDPFQTYSRDASGQQKQISQYADYYNSLISSYSNHDFSSLVGAIGSRPNFGQKQTNTSSNVTIPGVPKGG